MSWTSVKKVCLLPQIVRSFSFKGMTNKLFGQEAAGQRDAKLNVLEELIVEGEEAVKEKTAECKWVEELLSACRLRMKVRPSMLILFFILLCFICTYMHIYVCIWRDHVERAWAEMLRFQEEKDKDLRETLINYAVMQISMCKKVQRTSTQQNYTTLLLTYNNLYSALSCREFKCGATPENVFSKCKVKAGLGPPWYFSVTLRKCFQCWLVEDLQHLVHLNNTLIIPPTEGCHLIIEPLGCCKSQPVPHFRLTEDLQHLAATTGGPNLPEEVTSALSLLVDSISAASSVQSVVQVNI